MKNLFLGLSLAAMALLAACSSGSGTNSEPLEISSNSSSESVDEYDSIVEEVGNLPKCVEGKDGEVYYVKEAGVAYTCRYDGEEETGEWVRKKKKPADDDDDQESSSSSEESEDVSPTSDASTYDVVTGTLTDSRDGQTYRTVKIGDQVWMAENLNYAYTGVPFDHDYTSDSTSWCYDNDPANCAKYGRLYTWAAAMDSVGEWSTNGKGCGYGKECSATSPVRGVCPKGWHLPSYDEWDALIVAVDGSITEYTSSNTAGSKLKSATGWKAYSGITNEDAFGFSALPAGSRYYYGGSYYSEGNGAYFWSSAEGSSSGAYYMSLGYHGDGAGLHDHIKSDGFSVRCLKD